MLMHSKLTILGAAGLLLLALPALAVPDPPLKPTDALISNSGSTNSWGYTIYLSPQGVVTFSKASSMRMSGVPFYGPYSGAAMKTQARTLFHDLAAAGPLKSLPTHKGVRSVSFGTSTTIFYKGQSSPDLTSGGDPRVVALRNDIQAIARTLHLGGPIRPFTRLNR